VVIARKAPALDFPTGSTKDVEFNSRQEFPYFPMFKGKFALAGGGTHCIPEPHNLCVLSKYLFLLVIVFDILRRIGHAAAKQERIRTRENGGNTSTAMWG